MMKIDERLGETSNASYTPNAANLFPGGTAIGTSKVLLVPYEKHHVAVRMYASKGTASETTTFG